MKKLIFIIIFFIVSQENYAATFTLHNFSGQDIFVNSFWWQNNYVKVASGQKYYFNSGIKSIENIKWITDQLNTHDTWVQYETEDLKLDALKTLKEFRIYPNGRYEENFMFHSVKPSNNIWQAQGTIFSRRDLQKSIFVDGLNSHLSGSGTAASYLVIENGTNSVILIEPPVKNFLKGDVGSVSGQFHCIPARGSKIYRIIGNAKSNEFVFLMMQDNKWYAFQYQTGLKELKAGKIRVLPDAACNYYVEEFQQLLKQNPQRKPVASTPAQCYQKGN